MGHCSPRCTIMDSKKKKKRIVTFAIAKQFSVSHFVQNIVATRQEQSCSPHGGNTYHRIVLVTFFLKFTPCKQSDTKLLQKIAGWMTITSCPLVESTVRNHAMGMLNAFLGFDDTILQTVIRGGEGRAQGWSERARDGEEWPARMLSFIVSPSPLCRRITATISATSATQCLDALLPAARPPPLDLVTRVVVKLKPALRPARPTNSGFPSGVCFLPSSAAVAARVPSSRVRCSGLSGR